MAQPDPLSDGDLLVATVGDPEAFAAFYRRHVRGLLSFFRGRVGNAELALDLCAETFAAALEASPHYEHRPEPARGWLYGRSPGTSSTRRSAGPRTARGARSAWSRSW